MAGRKAVDYSLFPRNKEVKVWKIAKERIDGYLREHRLIAYFLAAGVSFLLVFIILDFLFPLPKQKIEENYSDVLVFSDGQINYVTQSRSGTMRIFVPNENIPKRIKKLFIYYEDQYFYFHPGINPLSIIRSIKQYLTFGKFVSGASTISMQVARMIEPKERTFFSKALESFRALQIEKEYSKDEILGIYLNMIPMGGNLEGIGSGAYYYFNKSPEALSIGEISLLIGIPQNPNYARPDMYPERAVQVRDKVLNRLLKKGNISEKEYNSAIATLPEKKRSVPPFIAPHLSLILLENNKGKKIIQMTLDRNIQYMYENIVSKYRRKLNFQKIKNIGILLIENKSGNVLAWIGGYDYDDKDECRIDAVTIKRSPGSTLKPFIYGKALDAGLITPQYVLYDVKRYYAGYKVNNFNKKFHGPVTATDALIQSLNSSAVYLLQRLSKGSLFTIADSLGLDICEDEDIGLSMALGANEISLYDSVQNYTSFSNKGRVRKLRLLKTDIESGGKQIMSEEAAYLISCMLSQGTRFDMPRSWEFSTGLNRLAWKTGTSFGNYDALCLGYNKDYTLGVWVGNADRSPSKALVGSRVAAPILFNLFNALVHEKGNWFKRPSSVKIRYVSAASGKLPTECTKHKILDYYIPGISPMERCDRYVSYNIDVDSGFAVFNTENRKTKKVIYEVYPPEALSWVRENIIDYSPPPSIAPKELKYLRNNQSLKVLSPFAEKKYYMNRHLNKEKQKIPLIVQPYADSHFIYWFIDDKLLFKGDVSEEHFFIPEVGKHTLVCLDNKGRSGVLTFNIELVQ